MDEYFKNQENEYLELSIWDQIGSQNLADVKKRVIDPVKKREIENKAEFGISSFHKVETKISKKTIQNVI